MSRGLGRTLELRSEPSLSGVEELFALSVVISAPSRSSGHYRCEYDIGISEVTGWKGRNWWLGDCKLEVESKFCSKRGVRSKGF